MKALSLLLSLSLATPFDGGAVDAGTLESRGVYFVNFALSCRGGAALDGGSICLQPLQLGEGWWLSRERMKDTGTRIVELQNDLASERAERAAADAKRPSWVIAGVVGFCVGVGVGVAGLLYLSTRK